MFNLQLKSDFGASQTIRHSRDSTLMAGMKLLSYLLAFLGELHFSLTDLSFQMKFIRNFIQL